MDKLLRDHPKATFVSGHGDVASASDVKDFRDYIQTLREDVAKAQGTGKTGQELTDNVEAELKPKYGDWGFYKNFVKRNIEQTAAELTGQKRLPPMPGEGQ